MLAPLRPLVEPEPGISASPQGPIIAGALGLAAMNYLSPMGQSAFGSILGSVRAGTRCDPLSLEAFRAWRRRWWDPEEGRGRRFLHYAKAAGWHCFGDELQELVIMPLGAARGEAPAKAGSLWQAAEPRCETWLATLPIFVRAGDRLIIAGELIAWPPKRPERWGLRTRAFDLLGAHQPSRRSSPSNRLGSIARRHRGTAPAAAARLAVASSIGNARRQN